MRVAKEVATLSKAFDVHFLGIGKESDRSFARKDSTSFTLVSGSAWSPVSLARLIGRILCMRWKLSPASIHVVDKQLLAVTWPALLGGRVVLDVFDSAFLRMNKPHNTCYIIKKLLYSRVRWVIVTDHDRRELLANFVKPKAIVIPNVPLKTTASTLTKRRNKSVTLAYFGSLAENRGTAFVRNLLEANPSFRVLCAGWPADDASFKLIEHPSVTYLGVVAQAEAMAIIAREADYIVSIYPSGNLNNYYASPNKLYDAIHTRTPLLIGANVKVSEYVARNRLGFVLSELQLSDPIALGALLAEDREAFDFDPDLIEQNCWENFEVELIRAHQSHQIVDAPTNLVP